MMNSYLSTKDITLCCGCSACAVRCPKQCIGMTTDKDGFYVPEVIDANICIDCGLCSKVCPFEKSKANNPSTEFYAAYSINEQYILNSSSGGLFPEIAGAFLTKGAKVYGAYMDEHFELYHIGITDLKNLPKLMRSKYYQSDIRNTYQECRQDLAEGKTVLFSGVPCQIQGLKLFLGKEYENLYTIDIICHGVPSPLIFREYKAFLERKHKAKLIDINFRDKIKNGWSETMRYTMERPNGKRKNYVFHYSVSDYLRPFMHGLFTRESCFNCPFKSLSRPGDVSLGDFWGYQFTRPELAHKEGLSLMLVNTSKGYELKKICEVSGVVLNKISEESVRKSGNHSLYAPTKRPVLRDETYVGIHAHGMDYMMKHYFEPKLTFRQKVRNLIPDKLVAILKSIMR